MRKRLTNVMVEKFTCGVFTTGARAGKQKKQAFDLFDRIRAESPKRR